MIVVTGLEHGADEDDEPPPTGPRRADGESVPRVAAADARTEDETPVDLEALRMLLADVLGREGAPGEAEASLCLVDRGEMAVLKAAHLDGDGGPTDVLSFPVDGTSRDAELIGDVVLCPAVAADQAGEHAGSVADELALLVVHGGLHLAGWDHADDGDRRLMWNRERELMAQLHRLPSQDPWGEES